LATTLSCPQLSPHKSQVTSPALTAPSTLADRQPPGRVAPEVRARLPGAAREPAVRRLRPQPLPRVRHPQERRPPRLPAAQGRGAQRAHVRRHGHGLRQAGRPLRGLQRRRRDGGGRTQAQRGHLQEPAGRLQQ